LNIPLHGLSKKSLALFASVLADYTHSQLSNLFMLFGIEDRVGTGSNKLARAMGVIALADTDPAVRAQALELLWHVLDQRGVWPRSRVDLDQKESGLLESLKGDGLIPTGSGDSAATDTTSSAFPPHSTSSETHRHASGTDAEETAAPAKYDYDFFISHASEDKDEFVRPLAEELLRRGLHVWYDEFSLDIGDSLRESIDFGLRSSQYGVVILSKAFFAKEWPSKELNGLDALQRNGRKVILPVWHGVNEVDVRGYSPMLADRVAVKSTRGVDGVATDLERILGRSTAGRPAGRPLVPAEPGKQFHSHLRAPNSQAWAVVVVGAVPERSTPLDDEAHDLIQDAFHVLRPAAHCERQTDDYASWLQRGTDNVHAVWIGEVFSGPVVVMMRAMEVTATPEGGTIDLSDLVMWWIDAIAAARQIVEALGQRDVSIGLAFNPYPVDGPSIKGVTFGDLPPSQRIADSHTIPPWEFQTSVTTVDRMTDDLTGAAASLLKVYSYRRLDATLAAIRSRLVGGPPTSPTAETASLEAAEETGASTGPVEVPGQMELEPIRLVRIVTDEVSAPRFDGTRGSALYRVPIELSRQPGARWAQLFVEAWNHPSSFTTMHRPGIASVNGDRIILDGTTLEEVKTYHRDTLMLAVDAANKQVAADEEAERQAAERIAERQQSHEKDVRRLAEDITF
jgi:hypothetical protein